MSRRIVNMLPRDLLPFVDPARTDDAGGLRRRAELAASIQKNGYQARKHGGMSGDTGTYPPSSPITLVREDHAAYLEEGNHRVKALNDIGYGEAVPVLLKDWR